MPTLTSPTQQPLTLRYVMDVRRYLSLAIGLFLVSGLAVFVGALPQAQKTFDLYQTWQKAQQKITQLEAKNRQLNDMLDPSLISQIQTVDQVLPSKKPLLELLTSVNQAGQANQITFVSIELTPGVIATNSATPARRGNAKGAGNNSLDISMNVEGTLSQLNQFFTTVEKSSPLTTVTELSLQPQGRQQTVGTTDTLATLSERRYRAEVTLAASYFTQSVTANLDAALPTITPAQTALLSQLDDFTIVNVDEQTQILGGGLEDLFQVTTPQVTAE